MIIQLKESLFLQTKTMRLSDWGNHHLSHGKWRAGKPIDYSNCPSPHRIVAPYELIKWSGQ